MTERRCGGGGGVPLLTVMDDITVGVICSTNTDFSYHCGVKQCIRLYVYLHIHSTYIAHTRTLVYVNICSVLYVSGNGQLYRKQKQKMGFQDVAFLPS